MASKASVLVVTNRAVDSPELIDTLRALGPRARFTLLVPATPHGFAWAADMKAGEAEASALARVGAERMRRAGIEVDGAIVGDPDPAAAVSDALGAWRFDEVIVSSLSRRVARRLRFSLPDRLRRITPLPVRHVPAH
jgi:nucleotide-binding universal stress UspA family protein